MASSTERISRSCWVTGARASKSSLSDASGPTLTSFEDFHDLLETSPASSRSPVRYWHKASSDLRFHFLRSTKNPSKPDLEGFSLMPRSIRCDSRCQSLSEFRRPLFLSFLSRFPSRSASPVSWRWRRSASPRSSPSKPGCGRIRHIDPDRHENLGSTTDRRDDLYNPDPISFSTGNRYFHG